MAIETVHTHEAHTHVTVANPLVRIINIVASIITTLLLLRLVLVFFGAQQAAIVNFIYNITQPIVQPFEGWVADTMFATFRLEWSSIIAIVIVWILAAILSALVSMVPDES